MLIEPQTNKHGMVTVTVTSRKRNSDRTQWTEDIYYVTPLPNPIGEGTLWTCSCPSFTMGKVRAGTNPFEDPCKHIAAVQEEFEKSKTQKSEPPTHVRKSITLPPKLIEKVERILDRKKGDTFSGKVAELLELWVKKSETVIKNRKGVKR